jgi:YidC/Oxa1 family membrane protein insertase
VQILLTLIEALSTMLKPVAMTASTSVAIILFTASVRLLLHPLSRAAHRGEKTRSRYAPQLAELKKKHGHDQRRLYEETAKLYKEGNVSPLAGCLPMLLQLPVFFVMYQLFSSATIGGQPNELLNDSLFAAPLGLRWTQLWQDGQVLSAQGAVFVGLFATIAVVATWSWRRARRSITAANTAGPVAPVMKVLPLLSFGTVLAAAFVPLAAGLYLLTTTAWTVAERAFLQRGAGAAPHPATAAI